jgi:hypothetical protein
VNEHAKRSGNPIPNPDPNPNQLRRWREEGERVKECARRSGNPIPNPDPNQAPQISLKEAKRSLIGRGRRKEAAQ